MGIFGLLGWVIVLLVPRPPDYSGAASLDDATERPRAHRVVRAKSRKERVREAPASAEIRAAPCSICRTLGSLFLQEPNSLSASRVSSIISCS